MSNSPEGANSEWRIANRNSFAPTRHSPFACFLVPATQFRARGLQLPFATPRGGGAPRDAGYHDAVPRRARDAARQALARRLASPAGDARLSALHRGDFGPGPVLPSPAFPPDPCRELLAAGS